jgi:hypothetical protein
MVTRFLRRAGFCRILPLAPRSAPRILLALYRIVTGALQRLNDTMGAPKFNENLSVGSNRDGHMGNISGVAISPSLIVTDKVGHTWPQDRVWFRFHYDLEP